LPEPRNRHIGRYTEGASNHAGDKFVAATIGEDLAEADTNEQTILSQTDYRQTVNASGQTLQLFLEGSVSDKLY